MYGIGLIGAGIFVADPMDGFLRAASWPAGLDELAWPLHFMAGGIGFFGLIGATLVLAYRVLPAAGIGSGRLPPLLTGTLLFGAFAAIAWGTRHPAINLGFTAAVVVSWVWLTALFAKVRSRCPEP